MKYKKKKKKEKIRQTYNGCFNFHLKQNSLIINCTMYAFILILFWLFCLWLLNNFIFPYTCQIFMPTSTVVIREGWSMMESKYLVLCPPFFGQYKLIFWSLYHSKSHKRTPKNEQLIHCTCFVSFAYTCCLGYREIAI